MQANVQVQPSKENQNYPPSPETKKTKILNKIQKQYELSLLGNDKQKIGLKDFYKTEEVQDIAGAMFTGNTETRITATYQDGDGTIDLVGDAVGSYLRVTNKASSFIDCDITNAILTVIGKTANISVGVT